jgi:hypothetical protein
MPSKKLGALLQAVPPATARVVPDPAPDEPAAKPQPAPRRATHPVVEDEPEVPLQVLVPPRIREELGIMVARQRTSLRSLILRGIRGLGIEVTEEEIRSKRGRKKSMNS